MASLPDGAAAASAGLQPTASDIANQFVMAYYRTESNKLHEFYNQDSVYSRVDPALSAEENSNVVGRANIATKLQEGGAKNVRVAIDSIDAQETAGGGIMIVLTGILTSAGTNVRAFIQTFVLAQEGGQRYYVHNDVLRYLSKNILSSGDVPKTPTGAPKTPHNDTSTQTPKAATVETSTATTTSVGTDAATSWIEEPAEAEPAAEPAAEAETKPEAAETPSDATDATAAKGDDTSTRKEKKTRTRKTKKAKEEKTEPVETKAESPAQPEPEVTADAPDAASAAPAEEEKVTMPSAVPVTNSWAGRLFFKSAAPLPLQPPIPDPNEEAKGKKGKQPKQKAAKGTNKARPADEPAGKVSGKHEKPEKKEGRDSQDNGRFETNPKDECSVYVANLNKPIKKEDVRKLFEPFGTVEDVHTLYGKSFCFVRFSTPDSVEKVLKAGSLTLGDATLAISRKKTIRDRPAGATRGSFRGGRGGGEGGRGGRSSTFKSGKADAKAAESNDGFTEANSRRNRHKRPQHNNA